MENKYIARKPVVKSIFCIALLLGNMFCYGQDYLYGLTQYGGAYNKGVPYQITTDGVDFISYGDLNGDNGEKPGNGAGFIQTIQNGPSHNFLLALTESGDQDQGYLLQIKPGEGGLVPSHRFHFNTSTGKNPVGRYLAATDGKHYGLTSSAGPYGGGAVFISGSTTTPIPFDGPLRGKSPKGTLIQGPDGKVYGMTELGGANNVGVLFSVDATQLASLQPQFEKLLDFDGRNGSNPTGNLVFASDGKIYGMTASGGLNGDGVLFSVAKDGSAFLKLLDLHAATTGSMPKGSLVQFTDGKLYGMTSTGGAYGYGTIFSITLTGTFTKILDFDGTNGKSPVGDLLVAPSGDVMYGTTYFGGGYDGGVLFKLSNGNQYTKLYDYRQETGSNPVGVLTMLREAPTITFTAIPEKNTLSDSFLPVVESSADMPVYFSSNNTSVAVIENNQVKITGAGTATITAFQLGNHAYLPQYASQTIVVKKVNQTITFTPIPAKTFGDPAFTLSATSSSGLPVSFRMYYNDVATSTGNTVSIMGAGKVSIRASQPGNAVYAAANDVIQDLVVERAEQTINFRTDPVRACCAGFTLSATASSKYEVSFKTPNRDKLEITGSYANTLQPGIAEVIAFQPGSKNYKPAEAKASVNIVKGSQEIMFNIMNNTFKFGDPPVYMYSGSTSGLPVTYTSNPPGIAVVEGSMLHLLGTGTVTITGSQAGNTRFDPATPVTVTITVNPPESPISNNTITWSELPEKTMVDAPFNLLASASSGLPVSYTSSNPSVAIITGNLVTITGEGSTIITATQPGNAQVPGATSLQKILQVKKQGQYIYLPYLSNVNFGTEPLPLPLTSSSGLPIVYTSSDNRVAVVDNYFLHYSGSGYVYITATQAGDEKYLPTQSVSGQFFVRPIYQSINFQALPTKVYGDGPFELNASASSGLPVIFTSSDPAIASVSGSTVTIKAAGTVTIKASQAGVPGYNHAEISQQLVISKASQAITFIPLAPKKFGDAPFSIAANSDSGLPVTFTSLKPGVAKVSENVVTITGNGAAVIVASQSGDKNYKAAVEIHQQFMVTDAGNAYEIIGSVLRGGPNGSGALYSIDSEGSNFNIIKDFPIPTTPSPQSGLTKGTDGRMYGNLRSGGKYNGGRIIRLDADGAGFTVLHNFASSTGSAPAGNLTQCSNGDLYGLTPYGGTNGMGTIFKIKTDGTGFTVLYNFSLSSGGGPMGGLLEASDGKLYGVTQYGGFFRLGTIFSINNDGTGFKVLFHLNNNTPVNSGYSSKGNLVQGPDGFLYGTFVLGGNNQKGTLFKIKTDGSGFTKMVEFDGTTSGSLPTSTLLFGSDGRIYGMTQTGGVNNQGIVFAVDTDGNNFTKLVDFNGTIKGANPLGALIESTDGLLYGMTSKGGANAVGSIFSVNKDGTSFTTLFDCDLRASSPLYGALLESTPGQFFGMAPRGGTNNVGVIFRVTRNKEFTVVKDFPQQESNPRKLIADPKNDFFYGITEINAIQSIFRINASGSEYERLFDLSADHSINNIFYVSTGHLWCTGNRSGSGFIFRIKTDGTEFEPITEFNNAGVEAPWWLVETLDGSVIGITLRGSTGSGVVFKMRNNGTGFSKLLDIPSGIELSKNAIHASDGNFYICTTYTRELYRFDVAGSFVKVTTFPKETGEIPSRMIELASGRLAFITISHGTGDQGSIFSVDKDGSAFAKIYDPKPSDGFSPVDMLQTMDGWIYVAAQMGGAHDKGVIYKIRSDGSSFKKIREFNGQDGDTPNAIIFKKAFQSLAFTPLPEKTITDPAFIPDASSSSGASIQFSSSNTAVAIIEHGKIKPVGLGTTIITATLPANANFFNTAHAEQQLVVVKGEQIITALEEHREINMRIYPNPVADALRIEIDGSLTKPAQLELIDARGNRIEYMEMTQAGAALFEFKNAVSGMYLLKVTINGKITVRRLLKL